MRMTSLISWEREQVQSTTLGRVIKATSLECDKMWPESFFFFLLSLLGFHHKEANIQPEHFRDLTQAQDLIKFTYNVLCMLLVLHQTRYGLNLLHSNRPTADHLLSFVPVCLNHYIIQ